MAGHEAELALLSEQREAERQRQLLSMRDKMAERKRRRLQDLRRRQEAELTREMLTQKKELDEARSKQVGKSTQWKIRSTSSR